VIVIFTHEIKNVKNPNKLNPRQTPHCISRRTICNI